MKKKLFLGIAVLVLVGFYAFFNSDIFINNQSASTIKSNVDVPLNGKGALSPQKSAVPRLLTLPPSNIGTTTVTLHGAATPASINANVWFYVFDPSLPQNSLVLTTPATVLPGQSNSNISVPFSYNATGLLPAKTYDYEICASTAQIGLSCAGVQQFTTL